MMIDDESHNGEDEEVDDHGAAVNKEKPPTALAFLLESDNNDTDMVNDTEVQVNRYLPLKFDESGNCSLNWWKINGGRFPQAAVLARRSILMHTTNIYAG